MLRDCSGEKAGAACGVVLRCCGATAGSCSRWHATRYTQGGTLELRACAPALALHPLHPLHPLHSTRSRSHAVTPSRSRPAAAASTLARCRRGAWAWALAVTATVMALAEGGERANGRQGFLPEDAARGQWRRGGAR